MTPLTLVYVVIEIYQSGELADEVNYLRIFKSKEKAEQYCKDREAFRNETEVANCYYCEIDTMEMDEEVE